MAFGGGDLTLTNLGAIDANAAGSLVLVRALAVGDLIVPGAGSTVIDNQGTIEGTFDGTFGLGCAAIVVANSGTWTLSGAVVSGGTTLNGGTADFDNALSFGTTLLAANVGAIQAMVAGPTLS